MKSLRWKLQLQMFLYSRCCHWFEIALRCLKMKKWLYFITLLLYFIIMCRPVMLQVRNILKFGKAIPLSRKKEFYYCYTIKIYFYIFTILYCVKKYRISENTIFFLTPFILFPKEKHRALSYRRGFSFPGGLSFVMFKHRFNTSTYHF